MVCGGLCQRPGRFIEDRWFVYQVEVAKKVYGIFIGSEHKNPLNCGAIFRADLGAQSFQNKFRTLPGYDFNNSKPLTNKMEDGGVKKSKVLEAINYLKNNLLKPGDGLIFYVCCHGVKYISPSLQATYILYTGSERNTYLPGSETDINIDIIREYPEDYITDSDLKEMLSGMDDIQKWVFIDSCYSGGFKSILSVTNACLIASTTPEGCVGTRFWYRIKY